MVLTHNTSVHLLLPMVASCSVQSTRVGCRDDIGPLTAVDVSLVGEDGWYMEKLLIHDLVDDALYEVECDCWFDDGNDPVPGSRRARRLLIE